MADSGAIASLIYEAGMLKRMPRSGWLNIGVAQPESVAAHSFRGALVALLIAKREGADAQRVAAMCVLHDLCESRTGDPNKINVLHYDHKSAELKAFEAQLRAFPELLALVREYFAQKTRDARVAKDADLLELLAQSKEYLDAGNAAAADFVKSAKANLRTKTAKKLAAALEKTDSNAWWRSVLGI
jgi:putative hydrolase of HD superfamily